MIGNDAASSTKTNRQAHHHRACRGRIAGCGDDRRRGRPCPELNIELCIFTDVINKIGPAELSGQSPVMEGSIVTTKEKLANGTVGVLAEVTFDVSAKDPCGTTRYHLGAFATYKNNTMGILIVSYSMDGDGVDGTTYQNLAIEILKSVKNV